MDKTTFNREILTLLSPNIKELLRELPLSLIRGLEEIRIGVAKPIFLVSQGRETIPGEKENPYLTTREDVNKVLQIISKSSLYAFEEELRHGYITVPGGHRFGLTGKAVLEKGMVRRLTSISSLNVRVAREVKGCASPLFPYLLDKRQGKLHHTLIISGPKKGKTTLLRDAVRIISSGCLNMTPKRVGVVDERSEIAGSYEGVPQLDVGLRTDVLDACPKAEGIMMMIRAMGPEVIVTDEIGREEDVYALHEALNAGVVVIASAHAGSFMELKRRRILARLLSEKIFERIIVLSDRKGIGTIEQVLDAEGRSLKREERFNVR